MGISSSSSTNKYTPSPQQLGAANTLTDAYNGNKGNVANITGQFGSLIPGLTATAGSANAGLGDASKYYQDVLGGKYLNSGNPYLTGMINSSDNSISDRVNGQFSAAGRTSSGANTYALTKALGENENSLRYGDYNSQLGRMDSAATGATNLNSSALGSLLGLGTTTANLPMQQAQGYASGIGGLGIGGTSTSTQNPSTASQIGQGLQIASLLFSDRRLKRDITKVGEEADGLGRYSYRYLWDKEGGDLRLGVMADDVARLRPHALGPTMGGFATVNYAAL